jgi:arsenate reductase
MMTETPRVVFLCVQNAGRSQIAAAWMRQLAGDGVEVSSGGSAPAAQVHAPVVTAMAEVGVDLGANKPRRWTEQDLAQADVVVTMGCGDACPVFPGKRYIDWELEDPAGRPAEEVRTIRDEIRDRVLTLMAELGVPAVSAEPA